MSDFIRRLVSGDKARFTDSQLKLDLDLVYLTDHIIIMGYPANGIEGWYRNRREDAKKFLDHRHGKDYWVFNFCPLRENSYDSGFFDGRVSRFPFPDHHAPPLAMMPLVSREMRSWLNGSPDRVAVLHCKAGKGRSGSMACAYLLSLDANPSPPKLERSYTAKQWARLRADAAMKAVPSDEEDQGTLSETLAFTSRPSSVEASADSLKLNSVLSLHTARRMKVKTRSCSPSAANTPPPKQQKQQKQGVSIPSQRRFLYYYALLLANAGPTSSPPLPSLSKSITSPHSMAKMNVRLTRITLRIHPTSVAKTGLVHAASALLGRGPSSIPHVWASLARYDDHLVEVLEKLELRNRDETNGREDKDDETAIFDEDGRWDKTKMVRRFARMGTVGVVKASAMGDEKHIDTYTLRPLLEGKWDTGRGEIERDAASMGINAAEAGASLEFVDQKPSTLVPHPNARPDDKEVLKGEYREADQEQGILLDAAREVRIKLFMGQVPMGWLWIIPSFHMPLHPSYPPSPASSVSPASLDPRCTSITSLEIQDADPRSITWEAGNKSTQAILRLTRQELDFPIGLGSGIVDVEVRMAWDVGAGWGDGGRRA
ncbi:hypothetical protein DXG03_005907 [Asterophora parasitica]|uniref:phosphatidylinositol-3,4,5-trisphosphate 3-phosphatase n=1 Tax=Asterophora parasitica TaxID=117018 RepID=A0A9P7GB54_9AGAR|nr:hypothetical protein DXG03_005907 [Asterophora parasitica]